MRMEDPDGRAALPYVTPSHFHSDPVRQVREVGPVGLGALSGFAVAPRQVTQDFLTQGGEGGIVFFQLGAGVDLTVQGIVFAIVVKPA
jgi:hypothetical protein